MTTLTEHNGHAIDPKKVDKYLMKLLKADRRQLETFLPNILATKGIMEREAYDYRTLKYRKNDPNGYNTKTSNILNRIMEMNQKKQELVHAFGELKYATDQHYEKTRKPPLI